MSFFLHILTDSILSSYFAFSFALPEQILSILTFLLLCLDVLEQHLTATATSLTPSTLY
jgi:hypothetical protein